MLLLVSGNVVAQNETVEEKATDSVIRWLESNAIRLNTVEAGNDFNDMQPLKEVVGDARIMALGEPTHGNREIFQLKHRMVEFLVTQMRFSDSLDKYRVTSSDWRVYEIVAEVPKNAAMISYGLFLAGCGAAWLDEVNLENY